MAGHTRMALKGDQLVEAVALRDAGWSFVRIGRQFGVSESAASNCVIPILGARAGHRMAERDERGCILPAEMERLRLMLLKGVKPCEIQFRMGVSASRIAEERRRYDRELKERGKRPLPPPGNGEKYSGARVPKQLMQEVERLFLEGFGNRKISERTGVSMTHIHRVRMKLVKRLKRKGQMLTGCDAKGKRRTMRDHARHIPDDLKARFREMLLQRVPVKRAANMLGIGSCSAYRMRDAIKAELGDAFPAPKLPGRVRPLQSQLLASQAIQPEHLWHFRKLVREHGEQEARRILRAEIAEARRNETFEQKLLRADLKITPAFKPSKSYDFTIGGIATGQAA